jgi:hypothetical protein
MEKGRDRERGNKKAKKYVGRKKASVVVVLSSQETRTKNDATPDLPPLFNLSPFRPPHCRRSVSRQHNGFILLAGR